MKHSYNVLGVMSGTSLDGIDFALANFSYTDHWEYTFLATETVPYSISWRKRLREAQGLSLTALNDLDHDYTVFLSVQITNFFEKHAALAIDFISSHGHTIRHEPAKGITFQIGNLACLAELINKDVVCDFRTADVAMGGQGAPLVPGGERHLFKQYAACVNLGGFANISLLGAQGIKAYDIGALNVVLNAWAIKLGKEYDENGAMAKGGKMIPALFQALNQIAHYQKSPPKSLGVEWVDQAISPLLAIYNRNAVGDVLHTFSAHMAFQIAKNLPKEGPVLFTGGGAYNTFLINKINEYDTKKLVLPSKELIEFKEALIFGFLGVLRILELPNCISSVTGADRDHVSGEIFFSNSLGGSR